MSGESSLDLRLPIGGLFVALGLILGVFGLITGGNTAMYERSAGININLVWGVVMVVTGGVFLALARRGAPKG